MTLLTNAPHNLPPAFKQLISPAECGSPVAFADRDGGFTTVLKDNTKYTADLNRAQVLLDIFGTNVTVKRDRTWSVYVMNYVDVPNCCIVYYVVYGAVGTGVAQEYILADVIESTEQNLARFGVTGATADIEQLELASHVKPTAHSMKVTLDAPDLSARGTVYACKLNTGWVQTGHIKEGEWNMPWVSTGHAHVLPVYQLISDVESTTNAQTIVFLNDLIMKQPNLVSWNLKESGSSASGGLYQVLYPLGKGLDKLPSRPGLRKVPFQGQYTKASGARYHAGVNLLATYDPAAIKDAVAGTVSASWFCDSFQPPDWETGLVLFKDIPPEGTLRFDFNRVMEIWPGGRSSLRSMARARPRVFGAEVVTDLLLAYVQGLEPAYPSAWNFLDKIWKGFKAMASKVLPMAEKAATLAFPEFAIPIKAAGAVAGKVLKPKEKKPVTGPPPPPPMPSHTLTKKK